LRFETKRRIVSPIGIYRGSVLFKLAQVAETVVVRYFEGLGYYRLQRLRESVGPQTASGTGNAQLFIRRFQDGFGGQDPNVPGL